MTAGGVCHIITAAGVSCEYDRPFEREHSDKPGRLRLKPGVAAADVPFPPRGIREEGADGELAPLRLEAGAQSPRNLADLRRV